MDKDREMIEKMQKDKRFLGLVGLILLAIGGAVVLVAALPLGMYAGMTNEDHITDNSIPIRDIDNATYTYDKEWFDQKADDARTWLLVGCVPVAAGYALLLATGAFIDDRKKHRMHCDGTGEKKYCPECGLKLSRPEKD